MPVSKRSHEGHVIMDNRSSPGVADDLMVAAGMPIGSGRGLFEAPTITCSHCERIVIINPLRNRERPYCRKCDHYICDFCGVTMAKTGICRPFKKIVEEVQEQAALQEQREQRGIIIPTIKGE